MKKKLISKVPSHQPRDLPKVQRFTIAGMQTLPFQICQINAILLILNLPLIKRGMQGGDPH